MFTIIALSFSLILRQLPSWDMGEIHNLAKHYATGFEISEFTARYLYMYPNNVMLTAIYTVIFATFNFLHLNDFVLIATIFNALLMSISVALMYYITRKLFSSEKALSLLCICLLTTPFYLYGAIYYADTFSMFLGLLIVAMYIFINANKNMKKVKKVFLQILLGVIIIIATKIKITTFFIVIAYGVYKLIKGEVLLFIKNNWIIFLSSIIFLLIINFVINNIVLHNKEWLSEEKLPVEHWISMGLEGNGGYNDEDWKWIKQYPTYEQRKIAAREHIKERLQQYDTNTFFKHLNQKLKWAWTDGSFYAAEKLRRGPVDNDSTLLEFILPDGKYSLYYKYIPQTMHFSMLLFMLVGLLNNIKNRNYNNKNIIIYILFFGNVIFFLLWENRSRYIIPILPFLMIAQLDGIDFIVNRIKKKEKNEKDIFCHTNVLRGTSSRRMLQKGKDGM